MESENPNKYIISSESVSEGHPDKVCDAVSDAILDYCLAKDPKAKVACEVLTTTNKVVVGGEAKPLPSKGVIEQIVRNVIKDIGYEQGNFHWKNIEIDVYMHPQSPNISEGVGDEGAGDQGIMFGYADTETESLMPAAIHYSHKILQELSRIRKEEGSSSILEPDSKSQLCLIYENGIPVGCDSITVSTQHKDDEDYKEKVSDVVSKACLYALPSEWITPDTKWLVNPAGAFIVGGPDGDCGLTGRKIIVDSYGGYAPHGGGAFSGKDPTKVDRSAAYMARYIAKNIVGAGFSKKCTVQLCYAIGKNYPLSFRVNLHHEKSSILEESSHVLERELEKTILDLVDLSPAGIRDHLDLERPIYLPTSSYGHFGREFNHDLRTFTWEKTDISKELLSRLT